MNLQNIQTFLCVARSQSLSVASNLLYISQPTVTSRLQQLEEELGTTLIHRKKGVRSIELTPQGQAFIPLAERWIALNAETENFAAQQFTTPLTLASIDSLNIHLLQPLFKQLTAPECALSLRIRTQQSPEIFALVESNEADVGFAFHLSRSNNVICKPLFSEKMVLLCSGSGNWPDRPLSPQELDPRYELFVSWSQDIQLWHDSWWSPSQHPFVHLDNAQLIALYMDDPRCWALCPASVVNTFQKQGQPVVIRQLTHTPPMRTCYYLTNRTPKNSAAAGGRALFQEKLLAYLMTVPSLIELAPDAASVLTNINHKKIK